MHTLEMLSENLGELNLAVWPSEHKLVSPLFQIENLTSDRGPPKGSLLTQPTTNNQLLT
jgi:hypothetical protein